MAIDDVVGAFGDAPGNAACFAVANLVGDSHAARLVEQRLRITSHHQQRHQIFEHRRAPREERRDARHAGDRTAEPEPVRFRKVALGDGDEAREPRF